MCDVEAESMGALLGVVLVTGTVVAYGFQIAAFIRARSGQGVSFMSLCLNMVASGFSLTGVTVRTGQAFTCLVTLTAAGFFSALPVMQGLTSFLATVAVLATFGAVEQPRYVGAERRALWGGIMLVAALAGTLVVLNLVVAIAGGAAWHYSLTGPLESFGIAASLFTCMVWVPQLVYTLRHRGPSSLSWAMLGLEVAGAFLMTIYLAFAVTPPFRWYVWAPYIVGGFLQAVILFVLYYRRHLEPGMDEIVVVVEDDGQTHITLDVSPFNDVEMSLPQSDDELKPKGD